VLLGALDAVLAQWRRDPSEWSAKTLEETYLAMVVGAYSVAAADPGSDRDALPVFAEEPKQD